MELLQLKLELASQLMDNLQFDQLIPKLQKIAPALSKRHPDHIIYNEMDNIAREDYIRKLIPKALEKLQTESSTL